MANLDLRSSNTFLSLSPITQKIFNTIDSPQASIGDLHRIIHDDFGLAEGLFKLINSACYAFDRKLESVDEAIRFVGVHGFRELVLLSSARKIFHNPELWYRTVFTAYCSKAIAQFVSLRPSQCSEIFSIALLLELGAVFLDFKDSNYIFDVYDEDSRMIRFLKEQEKYGIDSHSITMSFLESFKLPINIKNIIINQKPDFNYSNFDLTNTLIDLAYRLSFMHQPSEEDINELLRLDHIQKFNLKTLKINPDFVMKLHLDIRELSSL
jgi:HD-like signal output (HDOD) protein